jgi:hypothetical protein
VLLGLGAAVELAGQAPEPAAPGVVAGIVTARETGEALGGVAVWAEPTAPSFAAVAAGGEPPSAVTGPDGRFVLELDSGEYRLFSDGEGLLGQEYGQTTPGSGGTILRIGEGERVDAAFGLLRTRTISGRVIDDDGNPVAGMPVFGQAFQFVDGNQVLSDLIDIRFGSRSRTRRPVEPGMGVAVTDAPGVYRLTGFPPGEYYVAARTQPVAGAADRGALVPVYYRDTPDVGSAVPVTVDGGDVAGIDIEWRPLQPVWVRGTVSGSGLEGAPFISLGLQTPEGGRAAPIAAGARVGADGRFELQVGPSRSYVIFASARQPGSDRTHVGLTRIDVASENLENVDVVLRPPADIRGQVVASPGLAREDMNQLRVLIEWDTPSSSGSRRTRVNPDGTFFWPDMALRDSYRLSVVGLPPGVYLDTGTFGAADPLAGRFDLASAPGALLTLRLGSPPGQVAGTAVDERGVPHGAARVTLIPEGARRDRYDLHRSLYSEADGRFQFRGLPPGAYRVFAWTAIPDGAELNTVFLAPFLGRGRFVTIGQGAAVDIEDVPIISPSF